jgi:hypothetical protein
LVSSYLQATKKEEVTETRAMQTTVMKMSGRNLQVTKKEVTLMEVTKVEVTKMVVLKHPENHPTRVKLEGKFRLPPQMWGNAYRVNFLLVGNPGQGNSFPIQNPKMRTATRTNRSCPSAASTQPGPEVCARLSQHLGQCLILTTLTKKMSRVFEWLLYPSEDRRRWTRLLTSSLSL